MDYSFPKNNESPPRRFKKNYYFITLKNGEKIKRTWLVYSKSVDRVFCFCCMLFGKRDTSLSNEGYDKWKHVGDILKSHRQSKSHTRCMEAWHTLKIGMATMTTVERILDLNKKALYMPCASHTLNLVVCDAAKSSVHCVTLFWNPSKNIQPL